VSREGYLLLYSKLPRAVVSLVLILSWEHCCLVTFIIGLILQGEEQIRVGLGIEVIMYLA